MKKIFAGGILYWILMVVAGVMMTCAAEKALAQDVEGVVQFKEALRAYAINVMRPQLRAKSFELGVAIGECRVPLASWEEMQRYSLYFFEGIIKDYIKFARRMFIKYQGRDFTQKEIQDSWRAIEYVIFYSPTGLFNDIGPNGANLKQLWEIARDECRQRGI